MTKEIVEKLMRERGLPDGPITWRDNHPSTYQGVYDYLMKHPAYRLEHFGVES